MPRGESSQLDPVRPLLPRGIFDKETRRKAVAVVGAAMGKPGDGGNPEFSGQTGTVT